MILFGLFIVTMTLLIGSIILFNKEKKEQKRISFQGNTWCSAVIGWSILSGIILTFLFIVAGISSTCIYNDIQDIKVNDNKVKICTEMRDVLQHQYMSIYDTNFRTYESGMYDKITNAVSTNGKADNISGSLGVNIKILPAWPQTKYLESLRELSKKIDAINAQIYQLELNRQTMLSDAKSYNSGIWVPRWMQVSMSELQE